MVGCCQTKPDLDITTHTLIAIGQHPNLARVIMVSLGCEAVSADAVAEGITRAGKPLVEIVIQQIAGASAAIAKGIYEPEALVADVAKDKRVLCDDAESLMGIKCGASDTTSGLAANPVAGHACDMLIDNGGSCIFGETTEFIGAEHILIRRTATPEVGRKIKDIVPRIEKRAVAMGTDMRAGQPTSGNIAGGLTASFPWYIFTQRKFKPG